LGMIYRKVKIPRTKERNIKKIIIDNFVNLTTTPFVGGVAGLGYFILIHKYIGIFFSVFFSCCFSYFVGLLIKHSIKPIKEK